MHPPAGVDTHQDKPSAQAPKRCPGLCVFPASGGQSAGMAFIDDSHYAAVIALSESLFVHIVPSCTCQWDRSAFANLHRFTAFYL